MAEHALAVFPAQGSCERFSNLWRARHTHYVIEDKGRPLVASAGRPVDAGQKRPALVEAQNIGGKGSFKRGTEFACRLGGNSIVTPVGSEQCGAHKKIAPRREAGARKRCFE